MIKIAKLLFKYGIQLINAIANKVINITSNDVRFAMHLVCCDADRVN